MTKWVYFGSEGNAGMKSLLGGKGANLCQMLKLGIEVPPVFIITTEACNEFLHSDSDMPDGLDLQMHEGIAYLEKEMDRGFGDESKPLLVSVRSGSPVSMPGMMETVLNLGLNDKTVKGLEEMFDKRLAMDCYRRLIQMYSDVVLGIEHDFFEEALSKLKERKGVEIDTQLSADDLEELVAEYKRIVSGRAGREFPQDPYHQLIEAVKAVFSSWNIDRAIAYRENQKIPDDLGTAVNIQVMVFGNADENSATGVAFTRDPSTGEPGVYGEFLINAQGEDVVAGIRTPEKIAVMKDDFPEQFKHFDDYLQQLEDHYSDMQDVEFTIEKGKLWVLQTRAGKRTGNAAVRIAADMVRDGKLDERSALKLIEPISLNHLLLPKIDPEHAYTAMAKGLNASPGGACGPIAFTISDAKEGARKAEEIEKEAGKNAKQKGEIVEITPEQRRPILVRIQTTPDDIEGIICSQGVLTSQGGMTSHAAVVARGFGKPCVAGCGVLGINIDEGYFTVGDKRFNKGDIISIDGSSGDVIAGVVPLVEPDLSGDYEQVMKWADEIRLLGVRTNADDGPAAQEARTKFGAEGIGLTRTEHMFMGDRADDVAILILMLTGRADVESEIKMTFAGMREIQSVVAGRLEKIWKKRDVAGFETELAHAFEEEGKIVANVVAKLERASGKPDSLKGYQSIDELDKKIEGLGDLSNEAKEFAAEITYVKKFSDLITRQLGLLKQHNGQTGKIGQLLAKLGALQKNDFIEIFRAMAGWPVTIRLIDPPLHEFIPGHDSIEAKKKGADTETKAVLDALDKIRVKLHEENPMLGLRGCRLGLLYPEINRMQVKAIFEAALLVDGEDIEVPEGRRKVEPEIMIPLIAHRNELKLMKKLVEGVAEEVFEKDGKRIEYKFGTMIEIPRAALTSEEIAKYAEFFSFGTNDLSQTCYGLSRDDAEKHFLQHYVETGILPKNPFAVLDEDGVGRLMRIAIEDSKKYRPDIKLGICGEHGGDPESIDFCHRIGLQYVSCSPFRVPVARLAAAQARIRADEKAKEARA